MRTLRDRGGVEWQVWHVVPDPDRFVERRRTERRRSRVGESPGQERRRETCRRAGTSLADGWLCFQCPAEKRRLLPVPPHWQHCPETELERMLRSASPVHRALPA